MNFPNNNDFQLMFYIGNDEQELSNDSRFVYVDLIYGNEYYVYKEDIDELHWSLTEPLIGEEE